MANPGDSIGERKPVRFAGGREVKREEADVSLGFESRGRGSLPILPMESCNKALRVNSASN